MLVVKQNAKLSRLITPVSVAWAGILRCLQNQHSSVSSNRVGWQHHTADGWTNRCWSFWLYQNTSLIVYENNQAASSAAGSSSAFLRFQVPLTPSTSKYILRKRKWIKLGVPKSDRCGWWMMIDSHFATSNSFLLCILLQVRLHAAPLASAGHCANKNFVRTCAGKSRVVILLRSVQAYHGILCLLLNYCDLYASVSAVLQKYTRITWATSETRELNDKMLQSV
jgi:hypothetical protein